MTTFYARVDYTYSSGDAYFSIPFDYIDSDYIEVYINDEETDNFTFNTSTQIVVNDTLEAGDVVSIRRTTPIDEKMVVFSNTSILNKDTQNLAQDQLFDAVQEVYDNNSQFNIDVQDLIADNKSELEQEIEDFETTITQTVADNKSELEQEIEDFETEINEIISDVQEAADKINELEEAVETATTAAETASDKADEATEAATSAANAATQAAATLANAVTLTGTQTISGAKTFTNDTVMSDVILEDSSMTFNDTTDEQTITISQDSADTLNITGSDGTDDVDVELQVNGDTVITQTVLDALETNLQNQINYLQLKATGVFSEYLNFLRAGSTHTALKIGENVSLKFKLGTEECLYQNSADDEFDVIDKLDTGSSLTAGKDYFVYLRKLATTTTGFDFVVSLNSTYPNNYTADEVYQIGGFHTLCLAVTSSNAPTLPSVSFWSTHPAIGYATADIIPNSVWCLTHRPISDPAGMVYVDRTHKWYDIYLQSGTGTGTASVFGGTTTDTRQPILHQFDMLCVYKSMLTDNEFMIVAEGSNQLTAIYGAADPVTTGGHVDTSSKRMCSGYFLEDCCGALWQWLLNLGFNGGSSWSGYGTGAAERGQSYDMPYVLLAGGPWVSPLLVVLGLVLVLMVVLIPLLTLAVVV